MAFGLIDKLTNFLMPEEADDLPSANSLISDQRVQLKVHRPTALKIYIVHPKSFDDVKICADCLKTNVAVLICYEYVDTSTQQRIADFLQGVCFVVDGTSQCVSESVMLYVPPNVVVNKELYAYSMPTYIKNRREL